MLYIKADFDIEFYDLYSKYFYLLIKYTIDIFLTAFSIQQNDFQVSTIDLKI